MTFATTDIDRLMDNARVNLPGALDGAIQLEIFNILNDFFQKTNLWTQDISFPVTTANTRGTTITVTPTTGLINRLMYVLNASMDARAMSMPIPGSLLFVDVPNTTETWTARVALTVTDPIASSGDSIGFPEAPAWILSKYNNGLLAGVLGNMYMQVSKPYTNSKMALMNVRKYGSMLSNAKSEARHQNLYGGQTWRFPGFARTTPQGGSRAV
jgi:hypothetical protein